MKPSTSDEIRQAFLEFFVEMGHQEVASSPLPQVDNPTLLFTNAGMNQFADVFLGKERRPYKRAVTSQKCMRVQGKHNDLENVGPSPRHHTFFEMLGNFSFGDYFKSGAIRFAFEFMTTVCGLSEDRLWYTVHEDDDEAFHIWVDEIGVPVDRVLRMGDKTNFWMMGEIGPCGPTSEIHYDWGPEYCSCGLDECSVLLDNDCERWLEIWNLVFMQFNQDEDGTRIPLPKPGVDTGMGLERITSAVQATPNNYDNDLFTGAMDRVQELLNDTNQAREEKYVGYRVIADHGRAAAFLLADGVLPGNVGQGYVLRMIIRRAARYGRAMGFGEPFLAQIAEVYIQKMGRTYNELRVRRDHVLHTLTQEERRFARTLDSALSQLDSILAALEEQGATEMSGETAFDLYATHGLPLEITRDVAQECGFTVDESGFKLSRDAHAAASGAGAFGHYETAGSIYDDIRTDLVRAGKLPEEGVHHDPYSGTEMDSEIVALLSDGAPIDSAGVGQEIDVITAATPFYVEAGGEVSDTGRILVRADGAEIQIEDARRPADNLVVHTGRVNRGRVEVGQQVRLQVDGSRRDDIRRNHTATHLLHQELRAHLGPHVLQAGSLVAPDRLRFDFTHGQALDKKTLARISAAINNAILANHPVAVQFMDQKAAIDAGAMALFGEKYGHVVRTIRIGDQVEEAPYSFELCGGLHVSETAEIGQFHFISEGAVAAGVRRVEAVTGRSAQALVANRLSLLDELASRLNSPIPDLLHRVDGLIADTRASQKQVAVLERRLARSQFEGLLSQMSPVNGANVLAAKVNVAGADGLREMADWFRDRVESGVAVFATVNNDKPLFVATVTEDLIARGLKAGDLVREVAKVVGGGGGGRPDMAQAGGRDASRLPQALAIVPELVSQVLARKP